ncbi:hypothetical protein G6F46_002871 [Rhizopus delemar]|uniref:Uncharacterized protein n=2 Tax=Rhizopus TaxID=4842 RepID=A0A9P6ZAL0_9FUNG|nr:hypothetical protein G6F55_000215 [Rhizopus delemar]KAG1551298.1 hypothetical protein G6F51_001937 [Rhizopus arrhizus]KAG1503384.1 hypothetical protein G6F54_001717 [Rhizopus delemar]KAG1516054.1 hypothetical protein G6F53_002455 [Rhizopus delemar]KAG1522357.1 hypothetical protein G6F52_005929 [Rhizopus delemar]
MKAILDVTSKAMKPQGERKFMKFRGTICTDGVGVSVLKQSYDTKKKDGSSGGKSRFIKADEFQYVEKLGKEGLLAGVGKCVLTDPDCRDLLVDYLQERAKATPVMKAYYLNEDYPAKEDQHAGDFLPFRKMKLLSFINQQQADKRLVKKLKEKFGNNAILIFGNWSAGNNPRLYQREKHSIADRHSLLRCKNQQCLKAVTSTIEATDKVPLRHL